MDILGAGFHLFLIIVALVLWKLNFFPSNSLLANRKSAAVWLILMSSCACALYFDITGWSSPSVRGDAEEVSFYLGFSLVWIALSQSIFAFLGISIRDDVAERKNRAAGFAAAGMTIAATCCVAGANVGDGPGFEVVLACAALSTAALFTLWILVAQVSGAAESITIERDGRTGIRVGGWLAGTGMVAGACVAGDWVSATATIKDFVKYFWPLVFLTIAFAIYERAVMHRDPAKQPSKTHSVISASSMIVAGGLYAAWIGRH